MISDLITTEEFARIEARAEHLLSTARGAVALDPKEDELAKIIAVLDMTQELIDAHECIEDRSKAIGAESPAAYHKRLARYARQIRAERLLMLEYLL